MAQKRVKFDNEHYVPPEDCTGENLDMDPEVARNLFDNGAALILLDVPVGTEIGIDVQNWRTGNQFKGIKMIPPGIHFVYWSAVSKEGAVGPRTGFFHNFSPKEVMVKKFDADTEDFVDCLDEDILHRFESNLRNMDRCLGAYPYGSWRKWVSLSSRISNDTISRLEPTSGTIRSVTELLPSSIDEHKREEVVAAKCSNSEEREQNLLPNMKVNPNGAIRFTEIPRKKYPSGCSPGEVTKYNMDSSYQLQTFMQQYKRLYGDAVSSSMSDVHGEANELLAEIQFSFICFLAGQNYESFEQWKKLLQMVFTCEEAVIKNPELYSNLVSDLHFQIREVPDDFFVDIVSSNNFLVTLLNQFFSFVRNNESIDGRLKSKVEKFQANLSQKFNWVFDDEEDEEDKPVIVETE